MNGSTTRRAVLLGILSVVVLAAQVSLTRLFSVLFWYHFGFLILSTSLLGFGVGGLFVRALRNRLAVVDPDRVIAWGVALSGPLLAFSLFVITHNTFRPLQVHESAADALRLAVVSFALLPPFVSMGATVLFLLQRWSDDVDSLYAANLVGSGVGCLVAIALLDRFGGLIAYLLLAGSLPLLAAWYAFRVSRATAAVALGLAAAVLASALVPETFYPLDAKQKMVQCSGAKDQLFSDWTSLSKVEICPERDATRGLWGLSARNDARLPRRLAVLIDYWAYTTVLLHDDRPDAYDFIDALPAYMAYRLVDEPSVVTIGAGGGMDIRAALEWGASEVDAVEINPAIVEAMNTVLAEPSGRIYQQPEVRAHLAEGRRFVESADRKWDVIQISGVDTHSATQAGAFALSENFLYTTEAMATYFDHLEDDGILTLTRWYFPTDGLPRFSLRLFSLVLHSLEEWGVEKPREHMMFFRSGDFTVMLVKRKPITPQEVATVAAEAGLRGYEFIYRPDQGPSGQSAFYDLLEATDRDAWMADYRYDISPPSDDSPFFFEHRKLRDIYRPERFIAIAGLDGQMILALLLVEMVIAGILLLALSYRVERGAARPLGWLYFAAIGLGFMLVEVTLTQRLVLFLGHPVYALTIVLFTLLVASGIGSALSARLTSRFSGRTLLLAISAMMILWALLGTPLLRAMIAWPAPVRMLIAALLIAPAGVLMGTAFPEAVRRVSRAEETELGVYWAWNGVASVTASVLAVIIAMASGFAAVMALAAVSYAVAAFALPRLGPASD